MTARCDSHSIRAGYGRCRLEADHNGFHQWEVLTRATTEHAKPDQSRHLLPLRPDVMAVVEVPVDLTMTEAHRIADYVRHLVVERRGP